MTGVTTKMLQLLTSVKHLQKIKGWFSTKLTWSAALLKCLQHCMKHEQQIGWVTSPFGAWKISLTCLHCNLEGWMPCAAPECSWMVTGFSEGTGEEGRRLESLLSMSIDWVWGAISEEQHEQAGSLEVRIRVQGSKRNLVDSVCCWLSDPGHLVDKAFLLRLWEALCSKTRVLQETSTTLTFTGKVAKQALGNPWVSQMTSGAR